MIKFEVENKAAVFRHDELKYGHSYFCIDEEDGETIIGVVNYDDEFVVIQSERGGFLPGENLTRFIVDRGYTDDRFTFKLAEMHIKVFLKQPSI